MMMTMMMAMTMMTNIIPYRRTKTHIWEKVLMGIWVHPILIINVIILIVIILIIIIIIMMGCTRIPISTLSHIWVFVRLYGIVFVIIVIIIIIIMIIKSEGVNAQL